MAFWSRETTVSRFLSTWSVLSHPDSNRSHPPGEATRKGWRGGPAGVLRQGRASGAALASRSRLSSGVPMATLVPGLVWLASCFVSAWLIRKPTSIRTGC